MSGEELLREEEQILKQMKEALEAEEYVSCEERGACNE